MFHLWLVNSQGWYGQDELWACTTCLAGPWENLVPRLLEAYSELQAADLKRSLERAKAPPVYDLSNFVSRGLAEPK